MRLSLLRQWFHIDALPGANVSSVRTYFPELTGLRGLAMLMVVLGHLLQRVERFYGDASLTSFQKQLFNIFATPFSGCIIFFCVSGYSLFVSLHNSRIFLAYDIVRYISRKIIRIWPPYALVIVITYLFIKVTGYNPAGTNLFLVKPSSLEISLFTSLAFCHDLLFGTFPRLFPPGWFVETQIQFFIVCTSLWLIYSNLAPKRSRIFIGIVFLILFSVIALLTARYGPPQLQYTVLAFMPYFWIGALFADLRLNFDDAFSNRIFRHCGPIGWVGLGGLIVLGALLENSLQLVAQVLCLALIFQASNVGGTSFNRVMVDKWLMRIGVASYSIYLVHLQLLQIVVPTIVSHLKSYGLLIVVTACIVIGMAIVLSVSLVFFWVIERPIAAIAYRSRPRLPEPKSFPVS